MNPPLRHRLGRRSQDSAGITAPASRAVMARALFWFSALAALVVAVTLALPHSPELDETGLAGCGVLAAAIAALAITTYDALPRWSFHGLVAAGSVLATAAIHYWGSGSLFGPMPYVWPTIYAFWFFTKRAALVHAALIGALFALELMDRDPGYTPVAEWAATLGTLVAMGLLVAVARDRLSDVVTNLSDAARRDSLTGLLNRRGFEEVFDVELERARRTEQALSVIVGDLDRFKEVNDEFGHAAGDEVLRAVGTAFQDGKRSWDLAARVGGEEFAILAPDTDEHGAYILAERLRGAVERVSAEAGGDGVTASFGIVSFPVHGQTAASLLQAGDQALYAAKRLGRNRSVISSAEVPGILARAPRGREEAHVELAMLLSLAEALDVRDTGSATHCQRVGRYSELIARELGLPPDSVERVRLAGILHDVGQGRGTRRAARQAGAAQRGGMALGPLASRDRRANARDDRLRRDRPVDPGPPRAPGRNRVPGGARRRRGPARGGHPGRGRRLRGDDRPAAVSGAARPPGGLRGAAPGGGAAVRRARGPRAPASRLGRGARARTSDRVVRPRGALLTTHALETSDTAHRPGAGLTVLKNLDFGVLALALPVFIAGGFPMVAYAIVAAAWIAQRLLQSFAAARAAATGDRRAAISVIGGVMVARIWLLGPERAGRGPDRARGRGGGRSARRRAVHHLLRDPSDREAARGGRAPMSTKGEGLHRPDGLVRASR